MTHPTLTEEQISEALEIAESWAQEVEEYLPPVAHKLVRLSQALLHQTKLIEEARTEIEKFKELSFHTGEHSCEIDKFKERSETAERKLERAQQIISRCEINTRNNAVPGDYRDQDGKPIMCSQCKEVNEDLSDVLSVFYKAEK